MARLKQGFLEGGSGSIGNFVSYERHGKYFLRSKPTSVKQPNTPAQLAARQRFALVQAFASSIRSYAKFGFAAYAHTRTAYAASISWNLKHALTGIYPDQMIDFSKARVSNGIRPLPESITMSVEDEGLRINWQDTVGFSELYRNDAVSLLLLSSEEQWIEKYFEMAKRSAGSLAFQSQIPDNINSVHVYITFYSPELIGESAKEEDISPSYYCGCFELD